MEKASLSECLLDLHGPFTTDVNADVTTTVMMIAPVTPMRCNMVSPSLLPGHQPHAWNEQDNDGSNRRPPNPSLAA